MNIDLHTHAKWAKNSAFSYPYYQTMMRAASAAGLDAVALTEHFDTRRYGDMMAALDDRCDYSADSYLVEGVRVYPGMEVDVREGGHILLIGPRESIREMDRLLAKHRTPVTYVSLDELLDLSEPYELLRIGAHPYREANPLHHADPRALVRLDALDLNGRDLHHGGSDMSARVETLAARLGLPVIAGSDTHQPLQFGCLFNRLAQPCETIAELRSAVRGGDCETVVSPSLDEQVSAAEAEQARYKRERAYHPVG